MLGSQARHPGGLSDLTNYHSHKKSAKCCYFYLGRFLKIDNKYQNNNQLITLEVKFIFALKKKAISLSY